MDSNDIRKIIKEELTSLKEQQVLMNEKLDSHTASLMTIEETLGAYKESYQMNKEDIKRLRDRTSKIETQLGLPIQD